MSQLEFDERFENVLEELGAAVKKAIAIRKRMIGMGAGAIVDQATQQELGEILFAVASCWFNNTDLVKFAMVRNFTSNDDRVLIMDKTEEDVIEDKFGNVNYDN